MKNKLLASTGRSASAKAICDCTAWPALRPGTLEFVHVHTMAGLLSGSAARR